ncbi:MAG: bifunctional (p)ppGpp synthetase/guanosine-3',5'-bis(diphosphate) 3'-pyrophosphohydrolase [Nitrospirae bacterium]|nr:bifunctional (p)ppGpp synthetase/guanosine-3',5'-bis(diphosphate) 3'-pyrophosphohydrolase [Nitrospirota bacterium]
MTTLKKLYDKIRSYAPDADLEIIRKAYVLSRDAHCSQRRAEGSAYILHPVAVAEILADLKLDTTTIAAALLHDTIEDTGITLDDIKSMFGKEVTFLVDAVTKLSKVEFKTKEDAQAENFRKMLLAMSKDVRVILIKFADRLHNMRTISHLSEQKQRRIANETLEIYAPLSNRLGIGFLRTEFEDLCFKTLMPDLYEDLRKKVAMHTKEQTKYINEIERLMTEKLDMAGIPGKIKGRVKHLYGIHQKMIRQKIPFEQVHDVIGFRIITDTIGHCYDILGILHSLWPLVPGRFKDFISLPKSNLYQSLHTTVAGPGGSRIEFQIRTEDMDEIAEEGIAAHWRYKDKSSGPGKNERFVNWLRELVKEISDAKEFLEAVKGEVIPDTVYVFTPNGDIQELPMNSTPVDFAYSIHTQIGHKCIGAKVDGRIVPLRYKLVSGDSVEIITSPSHTPSKDWLKFVVTQRAKSRIKQWIKTEERSKSIELGQKLTEDEFRRHGLSLSVLKSDKMAEVLKAFTHSSLEDLYVSVGYGKISPRQIANKFMPEKVEDQPEVQKKQQTKEKQSVITIKGVDNILYHVAKCCFPVPGDKIIGFITKGKGVTIHRKDCPNLERLAIDNARLIDVNWNQSADIASSARLFVEGHDKPGIIANLSALISSAEVNITFIKAHSTNDKRALIELMLEIKNRAQLTNLVNKISQMDGVLNVRR